MSEFQNVVVLVVDTFRNKDIAQDPEIAPFLSEKGGGIDFFIDSYYSTSPWTGPAHASMCSGLLPSEHGFTTGNTYFKAENNLLRGLDDFHKVGLSEIGMFSDSTGFAEDFDRFKHFSKDKEGGPVWKEVWENDSGFKSSKEKWVTFLKKTVVSRDISSLKRFFGYVVENKILARGHYNKGYSDEILDEILEETCTERKSFVFANITPAHYPYTFTEKEKSEYLSELKSSRVEEVARGFNHEEYLSEEGFELSEEFLKQRREAYKASISHTDSKIKELYLESSEDTVFVVLGDHGELFGEYDIDGKQIIGHHFGTYKELIDVPLFIFSKSSISLKLEDGLFDHRDLNRIIKGVIEDDFVESRKIARSEYFGLKNFYEQFDRTYPNNLETIFSRKSFSLLNKEFKFDKTSEGCFLWRRKSLTESKRLDDSKVPDELRSKAKIFYDL